MPIPKVDNFQNRWRFLPEEKAITPPEYGFCQIIRNHWWNVCPERGLIFFWSRGVKGLGTPQCNRDEALMKRLGTTIPNSIIKQIPLVFVPINLSDYDQ